MQFKDKVEISRVDYNLLKDLRGNKAFKRWMDILKQRQYTLAHKLISSVDYKDVDVKVAELRGRYAELNALLKIVEQAKEREQLFEEKEGTK